MASYSKVNFVQHLLGISTRFVADSRLTPWHISLYYSLFQYWNISKFLNPLNISRTELMRSSKIGSANTYTKCLKELDSWGYLKYNPSFNQQIGSKVYMYIFDKGTDNGSGNATDKTSNKSTGKGTAKAADKSSNKGTDNATDKGADKAAVIAVIPYINNINSINNSNILKRENKKKQVKNSLTKPNSNEKSEKKSAIKSQTTLPKKRKKTAPTEKEKLREKKKNEFPTSSEIKIQRHKPIEGMAPGFSRPLLQQVQEYFAEKGWPEIEAQKYFNHYQSNGWLVGGKTPMSDWHASAAKWMLNCKDFKSPNTVQSPKPGNLNTIVRKNYNEPL